MSSPLNDVLAGFSRKYRKKAKEVEPLIQKYLDEGMTPAQAVDKALKEQLKNRYPPAMPVGIYFIILFYLPITRSMMWINSITCSAGSLAYRIP